MESWILMKNSSSIKTLATKKILCMNHTSDSKYFTGKICNNTLEVPDDVKSALCWRCLVVKMGNPSPIKEVVKTGYPRGWQFMSMFVDKEGNVYEKGVLNKELKGKYPPTEIKEKQKETKNTNKVSLKKIKELQKKIKEEKDSTKLTKLKNELSKIMKGMT